ncbi:DsrE family protein [Sphingobium sp. WCS2017Hpa-17]|uniref:DsrE family protein n=1 Tax=Sphingobium sp. WCS2017Hpa-17 TaxID=3073638 RepID=UPI002889B334|nr:DsrE family protein [Sphingobium sp. WCS2017Hpa-17]
MRGLTIVVTTADAERLRGALVLAAAQAALGGAAAIFLQLDAVALLKAPLAAPRDTDHRAAGLPDLAILLADSLALGVAISACQSGLALSGMSAAELPDGVSVGGPIGFLQKMDDETRLLMA